VNGAKTKTTPATVVTKSKTDVGKTKSVSPGPLKADGTPDKRYTANKSLKKDGTPDMRYKTNKTKQRTDLVLMVVCKAVPGSTGRLFS